MHRNKAPEAHGDSITGEPFPASRRRPERAAADVAAAHPVVDTVNAMGEGVILFRRDGTITTVSPLAETLTGLPREELEGKTIRTVMPRLLEGGDLARGLRALEAVAKGRTPMLGPVVLKHDTAQSVIVSLSVALIRRTDGPPVHAILTLKDVTEWHRTAELLNQVFDNTHMQIVYLDPHFHYVRVNRAYAEASGHEPGFFVGKNYFERDPHPEKEAIFRRVLDTGEPVTVFEEPFACPERPEQGVAYRDWSLHPIRCKKGVMEGLLLSLLDVTERVRARRKREESDRKYRELVENANSIIMRITPDHRILFFSEYAQRFFGYSAEEVRGRSVLETIVPPVDSEGRDLRKMTREITAHPECYGSNDNENVCKDGRRVWIHWSNRAIRDEHGTVREILCVGTDITERRKLAREAAVYRRRLQRLADRLTTTEEQARRRVATYIHDTVVQTLSLASIRLGGMIAELEKAGMSDQRKRIADVRKLLDQGTRECRGLMEELVPSLLYEIGLRAALNEFAQKKGKTYGIRILVEGDADTPLNDGLRALLFQCARELITNALKHAGRCGIKVLLSSTDEHVEVRVRDNGRGFDPEALDDEKNDSDEGGFGLFNLRRRLECMGGRLDIASAPGRGTAATIRVPLGTKP